MPDQGFVRRILIGVLVLLFIGFVFLATSGAGNAQREVKATDPRQNIDFRRRWPADTDAATSNPSPDQATSPGSPQTAPPTTSTPAKSNPEDRDPTTHDSERQDATSPQPIASKRDANVAADPRASIEKAPYFDQYRIERCDPKSTDDSRSAPSDAVDPVAAFERVSKLQCPKFHLEGVGGKQEEEKEAQNETNVNQRKHWVVNQYKDYSKKCAKKKGVMWKRMSLEVHDAMTGRIFDLAVNNKTKGFLDQSASRAAASSKGEVLPPLTWFDWASGCGADMKDYFTRTVGRNPTPESNQRGGGQPNRLFAGVGIDFTKAGVDYAVKQFEELPGAADNNKPSLRYCHADGTLLDWVPSDTFDVITSVGGLLHLPKAAVCPTMRHLVRMLKPKTGRLLTCYVHPETVTQQLFACQFPCASGERVVGSILRQNDFMDGIGMPNAYTKVTPSCLLWERL